MGEPKAITYKQVQKAVGDTLAGETWEKIGRLTGAGIVPRDYDGDASIDLTDVSAAKLEQIDRLIERKEEQAQKLEEKENEEEAAKAEIKERGNK